MRINHYPRPHPSVPDKAMVYSVESSFYRIMPDHSRRNCKRCFKVYNIQANGLPSRMEECLYHPYRVSGRPARYRCCLLGPNASPCKRASQHITEDIDPDNLTGFTTTKNNFRIRADNVYAIDCEMICTTAGMELASISVVDSDFNLVYETKVMPDNPIVDYLTEYSNLTERDFHGVTTSLKDVHTKLLTLFGERTILVGHGLNNDLLWLKLFHDNIVDTSVAYPHAKGGSFRNSLSFLKERYLTASRINNNYSKCREDAEAAMKLALLKCK